MKTIIVVFLTFLFSFTSAQTLISDINKIRTNPTSFIPVIDSIKNAKIYTKSNVNWTKECDETIEFLKNCKPVDTLTFDSIIYNDILDSIITFKGQHLNLKYSENIGTSKNVIANWIIDALVTNKTHRSNIFNRNFKKIAIVETTYDGESWTIADFN